MNDWREDLKQVTRNQIARAEDREAQASSELPREQLEAAVDYWEQHSAKWEERARTARKQKRERELFLKRILTWADEHADAPASEVAALIREDMRASRGGQS